MIIDSYNPTQVQPLIESIKIITLQHAPGNLKKVCTSVCKSQNVCPGLFAPTSRSPISKLFKYSESLGKSN